MIWYFTKNSNNNSNSVISVSKDVSVIIHLILSVATNK